MCLLVEELYLVHRELAQTREHLAAAQHSNKVLQEQLGAARQELANAKVTQLFNPVRFPPELCQHMDSTRRLKAHPLCKKPHSHFLLNRDRHSKMAGAQCRR